MTILKTTMMFIHCCLKVQNLEVISLEKRGGKEGKKTINIKYRHSVFEYSIAPGSLENMIWSSEAS